MPSNKVRQTVEHIVLNVFDKNTAKIKSLKLRQLVLNPITAAFLSQSSSGTYNETEVARNLVMNRVFGSSVSTVLGRNMKKLFTEVLGATPSVVDGIDIEFRDHVVGQQRFARLRSGPDDFNAGAAREAIGKFESAVRGGISKGQLVVAVCYGEVGDLNGPMKTFQRDYKVLVGADFWHRISGEPNFYKQLQSELTRVASGVDNRAIIDDAIKRVADELKDKKRLF